MLHLAALIGDVNMVQLLLEKGVEPAAQDSLGETPFTYAKSYAKSRGHNQVAELLLRKTP